MKKLFALILALIMVLTFVSCGKKPTNGPTENKVDPEVNQETVVDNKEEQKEENKKEEDKKEETKPQDKPEVKPEEKPEPKPEPKPEKPTAKTPGQILLADFKAKAGSASSASALAEALAMNEIFPMGIGTMPKAPGEYLPGFGDAEIKGYKEACQFSPFIGTIAFMGFVFILEDGVSASSFIANLEKNANLRWNVCTEADEMVTGSVGNKVFFVMAPKSFDEPEEFNEE